jgi:hypothetical protein
MHIAPTIAVSLLLCCAPSALAATIVPVNATASDTFSFFGQYKQENLINGSGLSVGLHDSNFSNMWMTNLGVNQASILFDLGSTYRLDGANIWNYNFGNPAEFQSTILRGVKDFRLLASNDGVSFALAVEGRLAMGTGQPLAAQTFQLNAVGRYLRFEILTNYGQGTYAERDWNSGLSEVRFSGTAVPEPATWAMLIGGFALVGAASRRRKADVKYA